MRGLILAGGAGTRLYPLTAVTNKHLVPVGNLPMIEYPLYTIGKMTLDSLSIVTGGVHFKEIAGYFASVHPEVNPSFHYQQQAGGIAQAIQVAEPFLRGSKLAIVLGDNIFEDDFTRAVQEFNASSFGAMLFLKQVQDAQRFGVAEVVGDRIINIEEKPKDPKSNLAVTGLYFYDETVFDKIARLKPSAREELEVTDLNNAYLREGKLGFALVNGFWSDAGTYPSRRFCQEFVKHGLEQRVIKSMNSKAFDLIKTNLYSQ
jgi:glucose-1-phosphate thymidylyltransferase